MGWVWVCALAVFQAKAAVGEKMTVTVESTLDCDLTVEDGNGTSQKKTHTLRREKITQVATRVSAEGFIEEVDLTVVSSTLERSGTNQLLATESTGLAGRSLKARRTPRGWESRTVEGGVPPAGAQALGAWNDAVRLLPPAASGESWEVEAGQAGPLLLGSAMEEVTGSLRCTGKAGDTIRFTGQLQGRTPEGWTLLLKVESGRLVCGPTPGRPASLEVKSTLEYGREVMEATRLQGEDQGAPRKVGQIRAQSTRFWVTFSFE